MDTLKKVVPYLIIFLLSIPTIWPLLQSGFFPMHDNTQPTRVYEMARSLSDGQFPVRWVGDLGYGFGYPIFNFYSPLPYYVGAVFVNIGVDTLIATKLMFAIGILISGFAMYLVAGRLWGRTGGIIAAVAYLYAPYHAVEIYVRGAVGEYWAYAFLPLVIFGILLTGKKEWKSGILLGGMSFAAVILSHNISAMILSGFLGVWFLIECIRKVLAKKENYAVGIFFVFLCGLGLSAFFWLPALYESGLTKVQTLVQGSNDFHDHFVFADQLWDSPWGYAGSAPLRSDGMSFKIGKLHMLLMFIGFIGLVISRFTSARKKIGTALLLIVGLGISVVMLLPEAVVIWNLLDPLKYIQYPWRFLLFVSFFTALLAGAAIGFLPAKPGKLLFVSAALIVGLLALFNIKYFRPQTITSQTSADYIQKDAIRWDISKISDEYLPKNFPIPQTPDQTAQGIVAPTDDIIVEQSEVRTHRKHLIISAPQDAEIIFSLAYFLGWKFFVDGVEVKPLVRDGLPVVALTSGRHVVTAYFADTPVRAVANLISLSAGIGWLLICLYAFKRKKIV